MNRRQHLITYPQGPPSRQLQPSSYPSSPRRHPTQQPSYHPGPSHFPQPSSYPPDARRGPSQSPSYHTGPPHHHHPSQPHHTVPVPRHPQQQQRQPSPYPPYETYPDFTHASYSNHNHPASGHTRYRSTMMGYARRASSITPQSHHPEWPDDPVWVFEPNIPFSPKLKRPGTPTFAHPGLTKRARPQMQDTDNYAQPSGFGGQQPVQQRNWNGNGNGGSDPRSRTTPALHGYQMHSQEQSPYMAIPSQAANQAGEQFQSPRQFATERSRMPALPGYQKDPREISPQGRPKLSKSLRPGANMSTQSGQMQKQVPAREFSNLEVPWSQSGSNETGLRAQSGAVESRQVPNQPQRGGSFAPSMGQMQLYQGTGLNIQYGTVAPEPMLGNGNAQQQMRRQELEHSASDATGKPTQFLTPSRNKELPISENNFTGLQGQIPQNASSTRQVKAAAEQTFKKKIVKANAPAYSNTPRKNAATSNSVNQAAHPAVNHGPFIIDNDDDDDFIKDINASKANAAPQPAPASTPDKVAPSRDGPSRPIDFSKGRRGSRRLTYGLDSPSQTGSGSLPSGSSQDSVSTSQPALPPKPTDDELKALEAEKRKSKAEGRKAKKAAEKAASEKREKESAALAKIREKEEMAAKALAPDALFQEPVNEAAQARIEASRRKEEQKKLEAEIRKKHKQSMAEELERAKTEAAEKARVQKEAEKAAKRAKTGEEREADRAKREEEEKKRVAEQQRKVQELLEQKRREQEEREVKAREKEAAEELKRQEDADKLKKALDEAKQTATSLKAAKKKPATEKMTDKVSDPKVNATDLLEEDTSSLFVNDSMDIDSVQPQIGTLDDEIMVEDSNGTSNSQPLTPISPPQSSTLSKHKKVSFSKEPSQSTTANPSSAAAVVESLSLRARAGWKVARKADVETKAVSTVVQDFMEKFQADQKKQHEAAARERAREKAQEKKELGALLEKLGSTVTTMVQKEVKTAVEKVAQGRPMSVVLKEQDPLNPFRGLAFAQQKHMSDRQFANEKRPVGRPRKSENQQEQQRQKREKEGIRLAENARARFEAKLKKDNMEQGRPMSKGEFEEYIERRMKEWRDKREKRQQEKTTSINSLNDSEGSQSKSRFGYEDVDTVENNSQASSHLESNNEKGRAGGIMARMRESNKSTGAFQAAAATKAVWGEQDYVDSDPDADSEESEEDPDYEEVGQSQQHNFQSSNTSQVQKHQTYSSEVSKTQASHESISTQDSSLGLNSENVVHLSKPRHLQDKDMVYVFSVQRSDRRGNLRSEPVTIKNFLDRNEANAFADDELRKTRWGPRKHVTQISQTYSKTSGLLSGVATLDAENEEYQHIEVVATAQYMGSLDDYDDRKITPIFKPTLYIVYSSITKMAPIGDEPTEPEEAEGQAKAEGKSEELPANASAQSDNEDLSALFEEEFEKTLAEGASNAQSGADEEAITTPDASAAEPCKHMLKETCKPLATYTDRELANKRASEIFLIKVKPVGGDVSLLEEYENTCVKQIREHLEEVNRQNEMFKASNQLENEGEELSVWVDDFELEGPLN